MNKETYSGYFIYCYGSNGSTNYYTCVLRLLLVQSLAGGAIAMAYVSTALNKMDNSAEGQQESLARTKKNWLLKR